MDEADAGKPMKRGSAPVAVAAIMLLLLVPVLYFLSLGPWNWAIRHGHLSRQTVGKVGVVYAPVDFASRNSATCNRAIGWYIDLWIDPKDEPPESGTNTW